MNRTYLDGPVCSSYLESRDGVPQDSILGPILSLVYINDLSGSVSNRMIMFEDDSSILLLSNDISQLISEFECSVREMTGWFRRDRLQMKPEKTQVMRFGNSRKVSKGGGGRNGQFLLR